MGLATAVGGAALEANWNKSIRIEDLVKLTNVGTRSLFRSFRKTRGYSPMAFAKLLRLNHAKEMLSNGGSNTSVMGVAFRCGFENAGHFGETLSRGVWRASVRYSGAGAPVG